jgi:hypothetical protein
MYSTSKLKEHFNESSASFPYVINVFVSVVHWMLSTDVTIKETTNSSAL